MLCTSRSLPCSHLLFLTTSSHPSLTGLSRNARDEGYDRDARIHGTPGPQWHGRKPRQHWSTWQQWSGRARRGRWCSRENWNAGAEGTAWGTISTRTAGATRETRNMYVTGKLPFVSVESMFSGLAFPLPLSPQLAQMVYQAHQVLLVFLVYQD